MKKLLLSLLMAFGVVMVSMAQTQDVVHLNNGGVIKGSIIEKTSSGELKIQTNDGSVFVYNEKEIKSISEEKTTYMPRTIKILDLPKHSFGIRAGVLLSKDKNLDWWDGDYIQFAPGAHIGGVYEVSLNKTNRWFFQTGLDIQYRRGKYYNSYINDSPYIDMDSYSHEKVSNCLYLEVPAMFSCKFMLGKSTFLYPSMGFSYSVGLWGHVKHEDSLNDRWHTSDGNPFVFNEDIHNDETDMHGRHEVDFKLSLNLTVKDIYVGGELFAPVCNEAKGAFSGYWGFRFSVGYNF